MFFLAWPTNKKITYCQTNNIIEYKSSYYYALFPDWYNLYSFLQDILYCLQEKYVVSKNLLLTISIREHRTINPLTIGNAPDNFFLTNKRYTDLSFKRFNMLS
jgi:hypothetical protein